MHGAGIATGVGGIHGGLSNVDEIHLKNTSIVAAIQRDDRRGHCRQLKDAGHITLSLTSGAGIGAASTMMNLRSDLSSSSAGAIQIKEGSFLVLGDSFAGVVRIRSHSRIPIWPGDAPNGLDIEGIASIL
jgi:hypothetical protein